MHCDKYKGEKEMVCKHCGKALGDEAKFCPYCGNKVELSFSYCPACGEEVEDQMTFCPACGYELDKALEEGGLDEFFEQPATQVGEEAVAVSAEPVKVENTEKKTKFKTVTIMKLVSSALLVVVALLAIFLPLCNAVSYEVVNEESVRVTNQISLLALTIKYIQAIMASGEGLSFNLTMVYGLLYLLFIVSILAIAWMGIKKLLECVKGLQNFTVNENSANRSKKERRKNGWLRRRRYRNTALGAVFLWTWRCAYAS